MAEPPSGRTTLTYRGDGRRVRKETRTATTKFIYDLNRLLEETDGDDELERQYTSTLAEWGELLSEYDGSDTAYHLADALGSTDALLDESQAATDRYQYRAFGVQTQHDTHESPFTFVGAQNYYRDSELELYYAGARYYDPAAGRWLSEDPVGFAAGDVNLYRYVRNNPVNTADPSGLGETFTLTQTEKGWFFVPADPQDRITDAELTADMVQALHDIQQQVWRSYEDYQRSLARLMLDSVLDVMNVPEDERDMDQATFMLRVALPLIARRRKIAEKQKAIDDAAWKYRSPMNTVEHFNGLRSERVNTFNLDPKIKEYYASQGLLLRHGPAITGPAALEYSQWDLPALERIYLLAEQDVRWEDPAYRQRVYLGYGLTSIEATLPIIGPILTLLDPDSSPFDRTLAIVDIIADAVGIGFFGNISTFSRLRQVPRVADAAELADTAVHAKRVERGAEHSVAPSGITRLSRPGRVTFEGMEVRAVRDLSHLDEGTLRAMQQRGFAATDINGQPLQLHHLNQNPAGPLVEIPAPRHSIGNRVQHPLGNQPGSGLTPEQRAAFNEWRPRYWQERATEELRRRGLQ